MSNTPQQKVCYYCKKSISYSAIKCPECHTDLRNWFMRHKFITTLLIIFVGFPMLMVAIAGSGNTGKQTSTTAESAPPTNESPIGKDAYNSANDVRIGKIIDVIPCTNLGGHVCYKIDQGPDYSRPTEWPEANTTVK